MKEYLVDYGPDIEHAIALLVEQIEASPEISEAYPVRWLAVALIDQDPGVDDRLWDVPHGQALMALRDQLLESLRDAISLILDERRESGLRGVPATAERHVVTIE